ncbi:MAG TPA: peptidase S10 [Patescibacteria group bacterium]|nr:peptidase S10 [Patescibacteria group bacterium]
MTAHCRKDRIQRAMKKALFFAAILPFAIFSKPSPLAARQTRPAPAAAKPAATAAPPPKEVSVVTEHSIRIGGQEIPYQARVGSILIKDDKGEPTALIYYTAYTRTDIKNLDHRPISFLYNGGPGSASIWLQMGAYGPRRVVVANAAPTGGAPYQLVDNQYSLIDASDLVFIDPVGTGFSHAVGKAKDQDFWGVDQDVRSLAKFINAYVTRNNRWNSPKFLIGESYGTFRSAALVNYLQNNDGMYFNGVVLMSSVLDSATLSFPPGEDLAYVLYLPSYAATAYYHHLLSPEPSNLDTFLQQVRQFAETKYADALLQGARLPAAQKTAIAQQISRFTGLSVDYVLQANLRVNLPQFMIELQRKRGLATGRLDARFSGPIYDPLAEYSQYDPQSTAITGAFTAAWQHYLLDELKFKSDMPYHVVADFHGHHWDWKHKGDEGYGFPGYANVELDLVQALITNPHLQVQVENGYYDLATPFFATEYTMDHLGLPPSLESHIQLEYYRSGHMMYLRLPSLARLKANVAAFIGANAK